MSKKRVKQYLMLLTVIGLVSIASGSGTFASFTAETTNPGNYFATGSLFLHDTAGGGTCTSESSSTNANNGTGDTCNAIFSISPGDTHAHYAQLVFKNAGTLSASDLQMEASAACANAKVYQANTQLSADYSSGTTLAINAATLAVQSGGHIQVSDGTNTEVATTGAAVHVGDTSITLSAPLAHSYAAATPTTVQSTADFGASTLCTHLEFTVTETNASFTTTTQDDTGTTGAQGCAYGTATGGVDGCVFDNTAGHTLATLPASFTNLTLHSGGGTGNTLLQLSAGGTRYFLVGIKTDGAGTTNADQDTKATIDLRFHIDQA